MNIQWLDDAYYLKLIAEKRATDARPLIAEAGGDVPPTRPPASVTTEQVA